MYTLCVQSLSHMLAGHSIDNETYSYNSQIKIFLKLGSCLVNSIQAPLGVIELHFKNPVEASRSSLLGTVTTRT